MRTRILTAAAALWLPSVAALATEAPVLTPFVGETAQEFAARKRGIVLDKREEKGGTTSIQADARGHFFVEPTIDGQRVRMLVDTGASIVALTHEDARRLSLSPSARDFTHKLATANGVVEAAKVRLARIQIGDILVQDVEAVVLPPGRLATSLLGMTFLRRLAAFEISGGRLALRQ